jgi:glutaredoxin
MQHTHMASRPSYTLRGRIRASALGLALGLALILLGLDRYAAAMYRPGPHATQIVLYTTTWCGYCAALRTQLTATNVPFIEHDVENTLAGGLGFWTLRARGVPVSVVGPHVVFGYQEPALESALAELGYRVDLISLGQR